MLMAGKYSNCSTLGYVPYSTIEKVVIDLKFAYSK
jgi:hypothetical protein